MDKFKITLPESVPSLDEVLAEDDVRCDGDWHTYVDMEPLKVGESRACLCGRGVATRVEDVDGRPQFEIDEPHEYR